jgi:hypothetical protein
MIKVRIEGASKPGSLRDPNEPSGWPGEGKRRKNGCSLQPQEVKRSHDRTCKSLVKGPTAQGGVEGALLIEDLQKGRVHEKQGYWIKELRYSREADS